jgi:hypothetical protein
MNTLEQLTDEGHRTLLRYRQYQDQRDLYRAVQIFQRVQEICSIDHPGRSVVLFNLAMPSSSTARPTIDTVM